MLGVLRTFALIGLFNFDFDSDFDIKALSTKIKMSMRSGILGINPDASKAHFLRRILRQKQHSDGCYPRNNRRKITNIQQNTHNITTKIFFHFDLSHVITHNRHLKYSSFNKKVLPSHP